MNSAVPTTSSSKPVDLLTETAFSITPTPTSTSTVEAKAADSRDGGNSDEGLLRGWDNIFGGGDDGIAASSTTVSNVNANSSADTKIDDANSISDQPEISTVEQDENHKNSNDTTCCNKNNDYETDTEAPVPKFQPGDHVIRWKVIKIMLWPIQIHGIVLESNVQDDGTCTVVIADFGYSSSQQNSKKGGGNKNGKKGLMAINNMMNSFYKKKEKDAEDARLRTFRDEEESSAAPYAPDDALLEDVGEGEEDELGHDQDGKQRFHLRTITDPNDLKKWSKVNYGASIFSPKGKLTKLKKFFTLPQLKKGQGGVLGDGKGQYEPANKSSFAADDDSYFSHGGGEIEMNEAATNKSSGGDDSSVVTSPNKNKQDVFSETDNIIDSSKMTPMEQLIAQANEIERKSRSRQRFHGYQDANLSSSSVTSTSSSSLFLQPPSSVSSTRGGGGRNFLKKFSLRNLKSPSSRLSPVKDNYASLSTSNNTFEDDYGDESGKENSNKEEPKLPKSDPRKIVLARVKFILEEQDKPESDSYLPPYHILYSNSECLAVWCKTGKFSTLQAAVFLHSTAVGNAKSTIMLTAGIAATQPWLIPVVGMYGLVAVGMPYYVLNKCKNKWKVGEQRLTNGFWDQADNDVIVSAIENWSGLTPDKQENSDEK